MAETIKTNNSQHSALLHCLASLGGETFAGMLLPKLVKQGCAGAVALACSQLRDLCHGSVQQLDLTKALKQGSSETNALATWTQDMPQHFSNCTSVQLRLHREADLHALTYLTTALARLPKLDSLDVTNEADKMPPVLMAMALYCMRTQLLQLRCLDLNLNQGLRWAPRVWDELGNMTQLTALRLDFYDKTVSDPLDENDVLPLKNLNNLQYLGIQMFSREFLRPLLSAELAAGLTSLTQLQLGGCPVSALQHVSSCVALRNLSSSCPAGAEEELGQAEWAAVGCLTGLTDLHLWNARFLSADPECCAAVNSLSRLQVIGAGVWSADMLSAFSSCTHLTQICGYWKQGGVAEGVVLPSVLSLSAAAGSPPLVAFPNLTSIEQGGWLSVVAFADIAQHCMGLAALTVAGKPFMYTSLPTGATPSARLGAIKSLSALTRTRLDFMVQDDTELGVLVDVAAGLLPLGLKRLDVLLLHDSKQLRGGMLMHLAKLQGLRQLCLVLRPAGVVAALRRESHNLLMAWSGIVAVYVLVPQQEDVAVLEAARAKHLRSGLPCPRHVAFAVSVI